MRIITFFDISSGCSLTTLTPGRPRLPATLNLPSTFESPYPLTLILKRINTITLMSSSSSSSAGFGEHQRLHNKNNNFPTLLVDLDISPPCLWSITPPCPRLGYHSSSIASLLPRPQCRFLMIISSLIIIKQQQLNNNMQGNEELNVIDARKVFSYSHIQWRKTV